jgi:hypothetical protein
MVQTGGPDVLGTGRGPEARPAGCYRTTAAVSRGSLVIVALHGKNTRKLYHACCVKDIRADSVWAIRFWPVPRNNRRNPDGLKRKPAEAGLPETGLQEQRCDNPTLAESGSGRKSLFAAVLCGLNTAEFFASPNEKTALVHTDRIHPHAQALQHFPPDSPGRRPRRDALFAVARLLCPDSSDTLFVWPIRFRSPAISVFTTV